MYAVYHGPEGLTHIARTGAPPRRGAGGGTGASSALRRSRKAFFDTVTVEAGAQAGRDRRPRARRKDQSADRRRHARHRASTRPRRLQSSRRCGARSAASFPMRTSKPSAREALPPKLKRDSAFLTHPVFHAHRSETELLRYMRKLSDRDLALDRAMIPLGSCTMKLNATTEMIPLTWPEFGSLHPFAPRRAGARAITRCSSGSSNGCATSPAMTRSRCSRIPARRANMPGCSRSAPITPRAASRIARCA